MTVGACPFPGSTPRCGSPRVIANNRVVAQFLGPVGRARSSDNSYDLVKALEIRPNLIEPLRLGDNLLPCLRNRMLRHVSIAEVLAEVIEGSVKWQALLAANFTELRAQI